MDVVTVFGASGFVGRYVVREFARIGARVRAAVRRPERAGFLRPMGDVGQIAPVAANIRDGASVAAAVKGADIVVNLVGVLAERGRQTFSAVHIAGARHVAEAAAAAGVRTLVHVSSIGADSHAQANYAATKGAGEDAVRRAFPAAAIVRPSIVFGPEDDFFNRFAALAQLAPALPLIGGGRTRFQPVYVGDLAKGVAAIAADPRHQSGIHELGGPETFSFRELMKIMLQHIGRRRLLVPVPFAVAACQAAVMERLPVPLLTRDQVRMLRSDNVVSGDFPGFFELGIEPTSCASILPAYLRRYRRSPASPVAPESTGP